MIDFFGCGDVILLQRKNLFTILAISSYAVSVVRLYNFLSLVVFFNEKIIHGYGRVN